MGAKDVHRLRVLTRRLRAVEWLARHELGAPRLGALGKRLRRVGRALGRRRALDVAREDASYYGMDASSLEPLVRASEREVRRELRGKRRRRLEKDLRRAAVRLRAIPPRALVSALDRVDRRIEDLRGADLGTPEKAHEARIEAKKIRYVLESVGRPVDELAELQARLGRSHDLQTLQEFLGRSPDLRRLERLEWSKARSLLKPAIEAAFREVAALRKELEAA